MAAVTGTVVAATAVANSAYQGKKARDAAKDAARAQSRAAGESLSEQQRQFDIQQEQLSPYREAGGLALQEQQALLGLQGQDAQEAAYGRFSASPAQKFLEEQGLRLVNTSSAITGAGGGERLRELTRFSQGLASQGFDDYYNRLGGMSGTGYTATTGGLQLGAQNVANRALARQEGAEARASGILGAQEAQSRMSEDIISQLPGLTQQIGGLMNAPSSGGLAMNVSNPNMYGSVA